MFLFSIVLAFDACESMCDSGRNRAMSITQPNSDAMP